VSELSAVEPGSRDPGEAPLAPARARPIRVALDASVDEFVGAVMAECARQVLANVQPARAGGDGDGVHQLRVGTRRMRAALGLFRPTLPAARATVLGEELRWAARSLSAARDWDVFLQQTVEPVCATDPDDRALRSLLEAAEAARLAAYRDSQQVLQSDRFDRLAAEIWLWASGDAWRRVPDGPAAALAAPARSYAGELLERRDRKLREFGSRVEALSPDELHRLRIRVKKLRYVSEFVAPFYGGKSARRHASRLAALQEALGRINDSRVAEQLTATLLEARAGAPAADVGPAAALLVGWVRRAEQDERGRLVKRWRRYRELRPYWRPRRRGTARRGPSSRAG